MKTLLTATLLATVPLGTFAGEATQFNDPPAGTMAPAPMKAAHVGELLGRNIGEATVFVDPVGGTTPRADVRTAARAPGRTGPGLSYGEAVVFFDRP